LFESYYPNTQTGSIALPGPPRRSVILLQCFWILLCPFLPRDAMLARNMLSSVCHTPVLYRNG